MLTVFVMYRNIILCDTIIKWLTILNENAVFESMLSKITV
jgi:hypothetical protein